MKTYAIFLSLVIVIHLGLFAQNVATKTIFDKAQMLSNQGKFKESIQYYDQIIRANPNHSGARNNRALCYSHLKKNRKAAREFKRLIEARPNVGMYYLNLGKAYADNNRVQKALHNYRIAEHKSGTRLDYCYGNIGNLYLFHLEKYDSALYFFQKAVAQNDTFQAGYSNIGFSQLKLGQWKESIGNFEIALELDPTSYYEHNNLGYAYMELGDLERSMAELKKSLAISEINPWCHRNLGLFYMKQGNRELARTHYRTAIKQGFLKKWDKKEIMELKLYCR